MSLSEIQARAGAVGGPDGPLHFGDPAAELQAGIEGVGLVDLSGRGRLQVVRSARLLAVTTNPVNPAGPDADPAAFRELVSEAAGALPVHDVVLEANGSKRKRPRRRKK